MRKIFYILVTFVSLSLVSCGGFKENRCRTITYESHAKQSVDTSAFDVPIKSHKFAGGKGTITFDGVVTKIGNDGFSSKVSLTSITIPSSITAIGSRAFYRCYALSSITCKAVTPPACGEDAFRYVDDFIPVYVPDGSVKAYKSADKWNYFSYFYSLSGTSSKEEMEVERNDVECALAEISAADSYYSESQRNYKKENPWIYGSWKCTTPYGTMHMIIREDGTVWDDIEEKWSTYEVYEDRIWVDYGSYGTSLDFDKANHRLSAGEGYWFTRE